VLESREAGWQHLQRRQRLHDRRRVSRRHVLERDAAELSRARSVPRCGLQSLDRRVLEPTEAQWYGVRRWRHLHGGRRMPGRRLPTGEHDRVRTPGRLSHRVLRREARALPRRAHPAPQGLPPPALIHCRLARRPIGVTSSLAPEPKGSPLLPMLSPLRLITRASRHRPGRRPRSRTNASSLVRKSAASAMSSGSPTRPLGMDASAREERLATAHLGRERIEDRRVGEPGAERVAMDAARSIRARHVADEHDHARLRDVIGGAARARFGLRWLPHARMLLNASAIRCGAFGRAYIRSM
jgi:hypothetical protein